MRVLFLDFDGVLNSGQFGFKELDPRAIEMLNGVVSATGAVVVVSSSWRYAYTLTQLRAMLVSLGFSGEVVDVTGVSLSGDRRREVNDWLEDHPEVTAYAIVDDTAYHFPAERFVRTDMRVGLQSSDCQKLVEILCG
jgi:hypothetical protein